MHEQEPGKMKSENIDLTKNQEGPRNAEGDGGDEDSMLAKAAAVAANFKVSAAPSKGTKVSSPDYVDLASGAGYCRQ